MIIEARRSWAAREPPCNHFIRGPLRRPELQISVLGNIDVKNRPYNSRSPTIFRCYRIACLVAKQFLLLSVAGALFSGAFPPVVSEGDCAIRWLPSAGPLLSAIFTAASVISPRQSSVLLPPRCLIGAAPGRLRVYLMSLGFFVLQSFKFENNTHGQQHVNVLSGSLNSFSSSSSSFSPPPPSHSPTPYTSPPPSSSSSPSSSLSLFPNSSSSFFVF